MILVFSRVRTRKAVIIAIQASLLSMRISALYQPSTASCSAQHPSPLKGEREAGLGIRGRPCAFSWTCMTSAVLQLLRKRSMPEHCTDNCYLHLIQKDMRATVTATGREGWWTEESWLNTDYSYIQTSHAPLLQQTARIVLDSPLPAPAQPGGTLFDKTSSVANAD